MTAKDGVCVPPRQALKFSVQRFFRLRLRFLRGLLRFFGFVKQFLKIFARHVRVF